MFDAFALLRMAEIQLIATLFDVHLRSIDLIDTNEQRGTDRVHMLKIETIIIITI
jgi:hypothetical protein